METGNNISASSLIKQDIHLVPDSPQHSSGPGQSCFVNIARNGIQILRRSAEFEVNEFSSFKFPHSLDNLRWSEYANELINSAAFISITENANVSFSIEDRKSTLVPEALFTNETVQSNFEFLFGDSSNLELKTSKIEPLGAVAIYSVPKELNALLESPVKCSLVNWLSLAAGNEGTQVRCHISETEFALVITNGRKLLFSNWFSYQKADDVLYFLMATLETQKILHSEIELTLSGEVNKGDEIHSAVTKFISKVSFANRPKNLDYSYAIKSTPEHHFPFIFANACA